jgi:hypothetical protein
MVNSLVKEYDREAAFESSSTKWGEHLMSCFLLRETHRRHRR